MSASLALAQGDKLLLQFKGENGAGQSKNIVLISGDDEYRSEEGLPMLAKMLSKHHGFNTTVLFAINPENNEVVPNYKTNIPGMEHLQEADLVIILMRFRELPDEQMKHFDNYLKSGKRMPLITVRTAKALMPNTIGKAMCPDGRKDLVRKYWVKPGWHITATMP